MVHPNTGGNNCASPSSRRAWIEIFFPLALYVNFTVALLAEGVDRNSKRSNKAAQGDKSPSSRRAWIEIILSRLPTQKIQSPSSRRAWIEIR